MPLTLQQINAASHAEFTALLDGTYEHSPWIAEAALAQDAVVARRHGVDDLQQLANAQLVHAGSPAVGLGLQRLVQALR